MSEDKPRRKRRTKANIVASIENAAIAEIAKNGFSSALVTNIIRSAQIEPQVFYNRYKDINDFYGAFVRRYDTCLQDLLSKIDEPIASKQGISDLLREILELINEDPVSLEMLRWEVTDKNKTTARTALLRELNFQPITQGFVRCFKGSGIDILGIFSVLVGGIYYISLHKKLAPFYGLDLNTPEGRDQLSKVIDYLVGLVFDSKNYARRDQEIAERLRELGVREDVIAKALGPSIYPPEQAPMKPASEHRSSASQQ